jgi:beta-phosphoglucomutase-like phosphatase (HAD superfamily)
VPQACLQAAVGGEGLCHTGHQPTSRGLRSFASRHRVAATPAPGRYLHGRFAAIASLEDITRGKPDPQIFRIAAAKSGAAPARSVVFEDAPVGIQAAKAAGMLAVGLTTTHPAAALEEAGADEVVANLVARLVERLKASSSPG